MSGPISEWVCARLAGMPVGYRTVSITGNNRREFNGSTRAGRVAAQFGQALTKVPVLLDFQARFSARSLVTTPLLNRWLEKKIWPMT